MDAFESTLRKRLSSLPLPSATDDDCSKVFRRPDATVVLFYDHLTHATPDEHVESVARVQSCMRLLGSQLQLQTQSQGAASASAGEGESRRGKDRRLHLLCCNDIQGPPTWCLPLVHSPQYLAHLQALSQEAREGDLFVPLEFDTEWEQLDGTESEEGSEDDKRPKAPGSKGPPALALRSDIALSPDLEALLGPEAVDALRRQLTPGEGDHLISRALRALDLANAKRRAREAREGREGREVKEGPRQSGRLTRRTSEGEEEGSEDEWEGEDEYPTAPAGAGAGAGADAGYPAARFSRGDRVQTSMGEGVVMIKQLATDSVVQVKLPFGVGYFNLPSVKLARGVGAGVGAGRSFSALGDGTEEGRGAGVGGRRTRLGLHEETVREVLRAVKADQACHTASLRSADDRFKFTNPFIYLVLKQLVGMSGVQSYIANEVGISQLHRLVGTSLPPVAGHLRHRGSDPGRPRAGRRVLRGIPGT
jgi:hypothetical protein